MKHHTCPARPGRLHRFIHNLSRYHTDVWDFRTYGFHPIDLLAAVRTVWRDSR